VGGDAETSTVLGAAAAFVLTDAGHNYAGEPHATVSAANAGRRQVGGTVTLSSARAAMALSRALLMAGALQRAVELSVQYVLEREQFGRPLGKFQVLQHYLAQMAGEACASEAAADNAVDIVGAGVPAAEQRRAIAAAKAVSGRAVSMMNRLAHQIHGAIGFTDEHRLQLTTRRLWSWRDEHGTESEWSALLGRDLVAAGSAALWPMLTTWPPAAD
jgi:alkylation response protein AidB-like acyl-CoA dehydrogenase